MSKIWPHFDKNNPCPACGGHDWTCRAGDKKFICMRVESSHPHRDGGWFHLYPSYDLKNHKLVAAKRFVPPKVKVDFNDIIKVYSASTFETCYDEFARSIGVSKQSIKDLGYVISESLGAVNIPVGSWGIPMRDGENKIIGIQLRGDDGSKKCVPGSSGGLFIPQVESQNKAYICEGASNTAALTTMGFYAIGRFNCNTGADMLKIALKRLGVTRIVIVADNDTLKTAPNGKTFRPGQGGASRIKKELGLPSVIFTCPNPVKDVRQLLQKLGVESARNYINQSVAMKVWTRC